MDFKELSLEQILKLLQDGKTTKKEVFNYFYDRIKKYDPKIKSFLSLNEDGFKDSNDGELLGIPIAIKDIFCTKGIKTTSASKILEDFIPPYDSTIVAKLKEYGISILGKLNMDEFAMGSTTENSAFDNTINPWGIDRIPGGSSGGSAACVAAGLAPAALGTDTGGSIRQPASMCGVVGFKPSYGRNSRYGIMAMSSSLDCPGTLTKTVKDSAILYNMMNGYDELENTSIEGKDIVGEDIWNRKSLKGYKIGVPEEYFEEGLDDGVRDVINKSIDKLESLGAEIKKVNLKMTKYAVATYYIIMPAEVSTNLSRYDGIRFGKNSKKPYDSMDELFINNRDEGFGDESKRRIILGSYVLSSGYYDAYFKKATQVRTLIIEDFENVFNEVDAIVGPVAPSAAWKIGEIEDPIKMYLSDTYTIPASLAGLPGISVPAGFVEDRGEKLPVGLQIITPRLQEQKLFEIAHIFEQNNGIGIKNAPGFE